MIRSRLARHALSTVLPTEHNGQMPHILKSRSLVAMLGVGVGLFLFSQVLHTTSYLNTMASVYPSTLIELTNKDRLAQELPPLTESKTLEAAASLKVNDMVSNNYFSHTSPSGLSPWHWFAVAKYTFLYAGENLAVNLSESSDVEQAWLNSPLHRANVLSPNFTEIGIATRDGYYNGQKTTYIVELFGTPAQSVTHVVPVETSTPTAVPVKQANATSAPKVAGESTSQNELAVVQSTPAYEEVKNTDPTLEALPSVGTTPQPVSWYEHMLIHADDYIAFLMQVIIIALILALTGLAMQEYEKRHLRHMAGGVVVAAVLVGLLFVGRIGVFASDQAPLIVQAK